MVKRGAVLWTILIVIGGSLCVWTASIFVKNWFETPKLLSECEDRFGSHRSDDDLEGYWRCIDNRAKLFIEKDYSEAKDLAKSFLTLLTAILVASITFSEKIVDLARSGWWSRGLMISCWILLLIAIASCGTGLALMNSALWFASYSPQLAYRELQVKSGILFILAGLSFGSALMSLLIAGIISLTERRELKGS